MTSAPTPDLPHAVALLRALLGARLLRSEGVFSAVPTLPETTRGG
ncbi:hypothetical protein [Micromonospora sp. DT47]